MRRRCPESELLTPSRLSDHELLFVGFSRMWQGGVATVHPSLGKTVHGLIYRMTPTDFQRLDKHEGGYQRRIVHIPDGDGELMPAQTYLHLTPDERRGPSAAYAAIIAHAYGRMGVDLGLLKDALLASAEG